LSSLPSIWILIKDALRGKEHAYTEISISKAIILLAIPMVIEMLMESLFAVVDIFFVAKLGKEAVAIVGLTESVMTIVYSLGFGIAMAGTAIIARRVGEKNWLQAQISAAQVLYLGVFISIPLMLIGIFYGGDILSLMGADDHMVSIGSRFIRYMLGGNIVILLLFLLNGVFRGAGDAAIAMRVLWISNGLNIILDPIMIVGIGSWSGFGLEGAAYATITGRGVGVLYQLYVLFNGKSVIRLTKAHLSIVWSLIIRVIRVASGGTGQFIISSASWIFLMRIMAQFGSDALAGYTVAIRVLIFTILPAWGLSNAAATLVGQNLGAGQPERAERSVWMTALYNVIFLGLVGIAYFLMAGEIISWFTQDTSVIAYGRECLRYLSVGYVFFATGMVVTQAFNGAGDTRTPTLFNLIAFWMLQIPLAYLLALHWEFGTKGVYLAIIISESILAVMAVLVFRRGKWKLQEI
jgi:putative MATE family efflux protein